LYPFNIVFTNKEITIKDINSNNSTSKKPGIFKKLFLYGGKFIDYKMAIAGAFVMGNVVFAINYFSSANITGSTTAALKQAAYTFVFGGIIIKTCERLAVGIPNKKAAIFFAIFIPSIVAVSLTFLVHNLRGTPHPLESTIPTAIMIIPATAVWGTRKRKMMERAVNEKDKEE